MPSEPNTVKLKKEIHHLQEYVAELKQQNHEQSLKIGELETQLLNNKNRELYLQESQILTSKEMLRKNVEDALLEEKEKIEAIQKQNEEYAAQIKLLKQINSDNELYIKNLQLENNQVKKQLIEFGKKHEASDFISEVRVREDAIRKKEAEYQKIVLQWNELRDQTEKVLAENRILRQLADVPENYGIDIAKIQMGDRLKIEDYKAKIRILKQEVDDLESERARLKHRLTFLANAADLNEPPFNALTPEQKVEVARYAQCLYEGTEFITPERYDLLKEIQALKTKLEILENQNSEYRIEGIYRITGQKGKNDPLAELREENAELKQLLKDTIAKFNSMGDGNISFNDSLINTKKGLTTGHAYYKKQSGNVTGTDYEEFSFMQLPAIPFVNERNIDGTKFGGSYRFNSKIRIDPAQIHQLFGVAIDGDDPEQLKRESAALQTQIIELLEIESRRDRNDDALNENLKKIYNKFEGVVLIQNEIFERYMKDKKSYKEENDKNIKTNNDLISELNALRKINKSYEEAIAIFEKKNMSDVERKMIDKMKENAILESNNMKLQRKYDCLVEEEKRLREFVDQNETDSIEKDKVLKSTIAKLKGWKTLLMFYLKLLNDKLKRSVDKSEFDKLVEENKYLRLKTNELNAIDLSALKQISIAQTIKMQYKDLENDYYECEEMKLDAQIELNYLKRKIQNIDPDYYIEQRAFRKLANVFNEKNLSYNDIIKTFANISIDKDPKQAMDSTRGTSSILHLLTMDNSQIQKQDFEQNLLKLGISNEIISKTDLRLIYKYLNCEEENEVDLRFLIKKLEQIAVEESKREIEDNEILQRFISCVRSSGQTLLSTFEFFDTNNNGCITRDEFKYALQQLKFPVTDEIISKLILLVSGEPEAKRKLDETDTFNYIDFCDLFEQRAKNYSLKKKKISQNKNTITIDWKVNLLTSIYIGMQRSHISIENAFLGFDKTQRGFLTLDEFALFVRSVDNRISDQEINRLYKSYDTANLNLISVDAVSSSLITTSKQIASYQSITDSLSSKAAIDYAKGYYILLEEKKYHNFKVNQMKKQIDDLKREGQEMQKEIEKNAAENANKVSKYFSAIEELMQLKTKFDTSGIEREELRKIEEDNEALSREVTILRIGMNTFKALYNSANQQAKLLSLSSAKKTDELDTYKRAIRELQSENNPNALIGKLYYTILISRWREANTLRKYDDFIADFSSMKEDNFQLETQNKTLTKDLTELQISFRDKVIENIRMMDQIENYENGIVAFDSQKNKIYPIDELKKLVRMLQEEKSQMTRNIISLKKSALKLQCEKVALENQIEFCNTLAARIRYDNQDEASKKLIKMCEEIADLRLKANVAGRENNFFKENETHLNKINDQLNADIKMLEEENAELESKFRKMEEIYRTKDEERQDKIYNALSKLRIYDINELNSLLPDKKTEVKSNAPIIDKSSPDVNVGGSKSNQNLLYENKINELKAMIDMKNAEILRLNSINADAMKIVSQHENFNREVSPENLISQTSINMIKDDETKLIAQTAHKTIKTLQEMLNSKNSALLAKDKQIEALHDENKKMKQAYLLQIGTLQDQIKNDHEATLKKLSNVIDSTNANLVIKMTQSDLSLLTLNDLEKLINDKDNAIKALAIELKAVKEENEKNYILLEEKNRKMAQMQNDFGNRELNARNAANNEEIQNMKKILEEKIRMINYEKEKIDQLKEEFAKQYQERAFSAENNELDKTLGVPDRLILNKEKSELYIKIDKLMKKNKKIAEEKKNLQTRIDELEKDKGELIAKSQKAQEQSKKLLAFQRTDTEKISKLRNENDKLKAQIAELNDKNEKMKTQLDQQNNNNANQQRSTIRRQSKQSSQVQKKQAPPQQQQQQQPKNIMDSIQDTVNILSMSQSQSQIQKHQQQPQHSQQGQITNTQRSVEKQELSFDNKLDGDLLIRLIFFCLRKNINMNKQLNKYDLSKSGKITTTDFAKAIDELRLGFIDYDLKRLAIIARPIDDIIVIRTFIQMMKDKNETYKQFLEEEERKEMASERRETTSKYNPFQNKNYNINY